MVIIFHFFATLGKGVSMVGGENDHRSNLSCSINFRHLIPLSEWCLNRSLNGEGNRDMAYHMFLGPKF